MFYSDDILKRKGGKFGIIWLAAFRESTLSRRDVFSVDVEKSCNDVIEYIVRNYKKDRPRFSLYLSSQLLYGSVRLYRKQTMYLCGDATEMMLKLAAFRDTITSTEVIDLDPTLRPYAVTFAENLFVADPYFGTMRMHSFDMSCEFQDEEFIRVSAVNGFYSSSPVRQPAVSSGVFSPPVGKGDFTEDFTDKEHDLSFRPEVGAPLQATPDAIKLKEFDFQMPLIPEGPPGDIELPLELDFQEGRDQLWTEFWKTAEEIAQEETAGDAAAAGAKDSTLTDGASIGHTSSVLDDRHQAPIQEETPAVFLDPNDIDLAPQARQTSPEQTMLVPQLLKHRRRLRPKQDYSFTLDPLLEPPPKRPKRRHLVFADREIQLPRNRIKSNIENSRDTCQPLNLPKPQPSDAKSLLTRPSRADSSSPSEPEVTPPLVFPALDLSPVATIEVRRTPDASMPMEDPSVLLRSADTSMQASVHSISHDMQVDITPLRSPDDGSLIGRPPPTKRKRSTSREKHLSLEEELSTISEIQASELPIIQEERHTPPVTAAHDESVPMPEAPEVGEKDVSLGAETVGKEIPKPADSGLSDIAEEPHIVIRDIPEEAAVEASEKKSAQHKELLRLIRGLTKKDRRTSFFEICPHESTTRKYAASVFAILLDLCGLEKLCVSQRRAFHDIIISRGPQW